MPPKGGVGTTTTRPFDICRFAGFKTIQPGSLIVIVHPNPDVAAYMINKILKGFKQFHSGDLFSTSTSSSITPDLFMYKTSSPTDITPEDLMDLYLRQGGVTLVRSQQHHRDAFMALETMEEKCEFLKQHQSLHVLPLGVFGPSMPDDVYRMISRFIFIPEAFLVFHHCYPSRSAASLSSKQTHHTSSLTTWKKKAPLMCMTQLTPEHRLLRIMSVATVQDLPPVYYQTANYVFLFSDDVTDWSDAHRRCKLKQWIPMRDFMELQPRFKSPQGLGVVRPTEPSLQQLLLDNGSLYHEFMAQQKLSPVRWDKVIVPNKKKQLESGNFVNPSTSC
jgi:hypothetical protein